MIGAPLATLAVKVTLSDPVVVVVETGAACTCVGAVGVPTITAAEAVEAGLVPRAFVAVTVHV